MKSLCLWLFLASVCPALAGSHGTRALAIPQSQNLIAHFDAGAISGVSCGATFNSWTDSVNGIVASQATSAKYPTYTCSVLNSLPAVTFGDGPYMTIASPGALKTAIDGRTYTVFIVFETTGSHSDGTLFAATAGSGGDPYWYADGTNVGEYNTSIMPYAGQTSFSTIFTSCDVNYPYSSPGPGVQLFGINGGVVAPTVGTSSCPATDGTFSMGAWSNGTFPVAANIFEIYVWNSFLTPPQLLQMQAYIDNKYAQATPWAGIGAFTVFHGDSITMGDGHTINDSYTYPSVAATSLSLSFGQWENLGVGGITVVNMGKSAVPWIDPIANQLQIPVILNAFEWANQAGASPTPYNNSAAYLAARKAVPNVYTVWGTSTDDGDDNETQRAAYDTAFDNASSTNIDAYVPLHTNQYIGLTTAQANYPTYWSDALHPTNLGYGVLSGLFVTGIQSLPVTPYLLNRDLDPTSNDNSPAYLGKAA